MTTADPTLDTHLDAAPADVRAARPSFLVTVLTTSDHKVIGRLYIGASVLGALVVGVLGVLLGAERIDGDGTLLDTGVISQIFAGYRVGLVFALAVPLFLGIALFIVPLQVGARSLAFPRAAAAGFWAWFGGIVLVVVALFNNGGPFGGSNDMVGLYLAAYALMMVGLTASAGSVAASVLSTRAPGMRMPRMPLFAWSALVWAIGLVLVLPVLVGVLIYLFVDYRYAGGSLFSGASGISAWTEFVITGPVLALFAVPAVGLLAELIPVTFRKRLPMRGVAFTGLALVALGLLVRRRPAARRHPRHGPIRRSRATTTPPSSATSRPTRCSWCCPCSVCSSCSPSARSPASRSAAATRGPARRPNVTAPLAFALLGVTLVALGMIGNLLAPFTDLDLQGTVFEEGATVAVVYGVLLAGLGAVAFWIPKATGARLPDGPLFGLAALGWLGALLASVPYGIAGFLDQPGYAAVWSNDGPGELLNALVTIGHGLVVIAAIAMVGLVLTARRASVGAGDADPWGGHTLEWTTTSPAPRDNFAETPSVMSPEPILDLTAAPSGSGS